MVQSVAPCAAMVQVNSAAIVGRVVRNHAGKYNTCVFNVNATAVCVGVIVEHKGVGQAASVYVCGSSVAFCMVFFYYTVLSISI